MISDDLVLKMLIRHEGNRLRLYTCPAGKFSIGVGRNLEDNGISESESLYLASNDLNTAKFQANSFPWFKALNDAQQAVVVMMVFNLGINKFLEFKNTIQALKERNCGLAAKEMLNSLWSKQVGKRATELAAIMKTGQW